MNLNAPRCPNCGEQDLYRDSADVGVGVIYGPWACPCGWSEDPYYDASQAPSHATREHPEHLVFADGSMMPKAGVRENLKRFGIELPEDL